MTDSEMLELAAKAAGLTIEITGDQIIVPYAPEHPRAQEGIYGYHWNPLLSDGDALRLAVKLKFEVTVGFDRTACELADSTQNDYLEETHDSDDMAATRRAIVRVAAKIGESMP